MQSHVHQLCSEETLRNQFPMALPAQIAASLGVVVATPTHPVQCQAGIGASRADKASAAGRVCSLLALRAVCTSAKVQIMTQRGAALAKHIHT